MSKEVRTFKGVSLRAEGDGSATPLRLSGYAAKFFSSTLINKGATNQFRETIAPTAFARALREKADVRMLRNHDYNYVLGRTKSGTLRLSTDNVGLFFDCNLPDTQDARDLHTIIGRGDMDQCSFAFKAVKDEWGDSDDYDENGARIPLRTLRDVDLFDISAVTFPAYEDTSVSARALETVAARRGNQRVAPAPAPAKGRMDAERILLINHLYNSDQILKDNDMAHRQRMAGYDERDHAAKLAEIERLQKRIKHGRFSTLESYVKANEDLQALLTAVGKSAPAPQLS